MESHEGLKWELGFACFWNGKMAFIHWDWNSQSKRRSGHNEKGNGIK